MPAALAALSAHDVHAGLEGLVRVRGLADHVHHHDAGLVQAVDDVLGRDPDGRDEQTRFFLDHHVNQLVQLPVRVVVVCLARGAANLCSPIRSHPYSRADCASPLFVLAAPVSALPTSLRPPSTSTSLQFHPSLLPYLHITTRNP